MVHFEGAPKPRMTMAERLQQRLDADRGNAAEAQPVVESSPEDDRLVEMIRAVNEKTSARAAERDEVVEAPLSMPTTIERPPVAEQSAAEKEQADRLEYARLLQENAMRVRQKKILDQARIAEERAKLMQLPAAPKPSGVSYRAVERGPEPMPKVESQRVYETEYGPLMILSVDADRRTMYFTTPEERRRVDAAQSRDEGQSSLDVADFRNVVALSPDQARKFLERVPEATEQNVIIESPPPSTSGYLQNRYGMAA
jgi:hypothetical protein